MNCSARVDDLREPGPAPIHVWIGSRCVEDSEVEQLEALLSDAERERANRFGTSTLRRRFIVARALLRRLLSEHVSAPPASVRFGYGPQGKPCLPDHPELCFNLSHAGNQVVIAVAWQREVGVDIVAASSDVDCSGVAQLAFSPAEHAALGALEPLERREAFFRIWSRKEAYIKARGTGLSYPTRSFTVSAAAGDRDALLADENDPGSERRWRIVEIEAPAGFHCALAVKGRDGSISRVDAR